MEVVVLWPLVVLQEGFPEKQDVQGQPDQLHQTKGERKQKVKHKHNLMNGNLKDIPWTQYFQWNLN